MKIIGITGGTGSGKSILSKECLNCGATVVDSDVIAHQVSKKGEKAYEEIVENFGDKILDENGEINRNILGGIVFKFPQKLELLEKITHKYIFEKMREEIKEAKTDVVVLDVPLLFQCDFPIKCDLTVAVIADDEVRIQRIINRDNISREKAVLRMQNQLTNAEYMKLADVCFENNGGIEEIRDFANKLCR